MDDNASKGGSYVRQTDGSLKLVARTEATKAPAPVIEKQIRASAGKKENVDG